MFDILCYLFFVFQTGFILERFGNVFQLNKS